MELSSLAALVGVGAPVARGVILELHEEGEILVEVAADPPLRLLCDFLQTSDTPSLVLQPGQRVLVCLPRNLEEKGCVLGRIGTYVAPEPAEPPDTDRVLVEADKELVLKCGEASVTLTERGQILIKGKDVVSRASRNQRIKGGSVQIN
jgi:hypothetical protein